VSTSTVDAPIDVPADSRWERVLRAYSDALEQQRTVLLAIELDVLANRDVVVPLGFVPPSSMPPLPAELDRWARQLMEQTNGLIQLANELAARPRPGRHLAARRPAPSAPPSNPALDRAL